MNVATEFSLPKSTHFGLLRGIYNLIKPNYTIITQLGLGDALAKEADRFCDIGVVPFLATSIRAYDDSQSSSSLVITSDIIQFAISILKLHQDDGEHRFSARLAEKFNDDGVLYEPLIGLQRSLALQSKPLSFSTLMPSLILLSKLSLRSSLFTAPIPLLQESILPSLVDDDDNIRDCFVARKILAYLGLEYERFCANLTTSKNVRNTSHHLALACRIVPILFESIAPRSSSASSSGSTSLVANQYRSNHTTPVALDRRERDALQRTAILYVLRICGNIMDKLECGEEKTQEQLVSLVRIVAAKGLFSINPTASFFQLFGDHDTQLLEALYWLQLISSRLQTHSSATLVRNLFAKVPPLSPFLSVLNPYSLFADFLDFLQHDHTILIDFMLSSESEKFLRYLLGFVKICLADWNRAFFTLYNLKRKKSFTAKRDSKSLSSQEIDLLLEHLLAKVSLNPDDEDDAEEAESNTKGSYDDINEEPSPSKLDVILKSNADEETEFDATISTLIRLRVHLEHAIEKNLLSYNVQPLMSRLIEIEGNYERQGEEE